MFFFLILNHLPKDYIEKYGEYKILNFIEREFGGWPLLDNRFFNRSPESTLKLLISLFKNGISPLFNMYVTASPSDPNFSTIRVKRLDSN